MIVGDDLYFQVRIESVFESAGYEVYTCSVPDALIIAAEEQHSGVWIVDMNSMGEWAGLLNEVRLRSPEAFIVAFGSHKRTNDFKTALDAGADHVFARSKFVEMLPTLPAMGRES